MVDAKSGSAGNAVEPAAPEEAMDADVADPGEVEAIKESQVQRQEGKYGAVKAKPHKPPASEEQAQEENKTSWIEIEMVDMNDNPIPGEKYEIKLPDGSVATGTLDGQGFARVDGIEPGSCEVTFPDLDGRSWEKK